jgi:uroporphyrinogen decarboxylase
MTPRERILKTCNFNESDRVPIDIGGTIASGLCIDHYCDLLRYLNIDELPKVWEQYQMLARVEEPVRKRLRGDVIVLEGPSVRWGLHNKDWKKWRTCKGNEVLMPGDFNPIIDEKGALILNDKNGRPIARMAKDTLYFEPANETKMSSEIVKMDPKKWKESIELYTDEELKQITIEAKNLHENTEYAVSGFFGRAALGNSGSLFAGHTVTDWLCILLTERKYAEEILQATAERAVENVKLYLEAVGDNIDIIFISGTDFGTQRMEFFNPDIWHDLILPRYKMINDYVHKKSRAKTFIHSCGSIYNIIEYIIAAGFDILNPVQTTAYNMDAAGLKEKFGGRIVFWGGGVDTQTVLTFGTEDEVREQVKERIKIFAPGGGFVFSPTHNIQYGVAPKYLLAAADTAYEYGTYPIVTIKQNLKKTK